MDLVQTSETLIDQNAKTVLNTARSVLYRNVVFVAVAAVSSFCLLTTIGQAQAEEEALPNYAAPPSYAQPVPTPQNNVSSNPGDQAYSCTTSDHATRTIRLCTPLIRDPNSSDKVRIFALMKRAQAWVVEEELWSGINDYSKVIDIDPEHTNALFARSELYSELKEYELEQKDLTRLIELDPREISNYCRRGLSKNKARNFSGAIADYTMALEKDASRLDCLVERGDVYAAMGDHDKAFEQYKNALATDETFWMAHYQRGVLHKKRGEKHRAIADFERVLALTSFNLKAMRQLQRLSLYTPWTEQDGS